jgi:hypothetical protein
MQNISAIKKDYVEIAQRNNQIQGLHNILYKLLHIQNLAFKCQNSNNPPWRTDQISNNLCLTCLGISDRHITLRTATPAKVVPLHQRNFIGAVKKKNMV